MKIIYKIFISFILLYLLYGVFLSQFELNIIKPSIGRVHPEGFYDYAGVLNIHSLKSTGSGDYKDIVLAAQKTGLDFIFITDLNDIDVDKTAEKYYDHLLVFIDSEFSYLDSRVLFYGKEKYKDFSSIGQSQAKISDRLSDHNSSTNKDGLLVLAHPFKSGHEWQGDLPSSFDGIEVLNLKSIWQSVWKNNKLSFFWSMFIYPFNPELALLRMFPFPKREFKLWDQLNAKKRTLGFAGTDAEAKLKFPKNLEIPSYETLFNIIRTHVILSSELTGDFRRDSKKIKQALVKGHFYFSLDKMANPVGFNAIVSGPTKKNYVMGEKISWTESLELDINFQQKPLYPIDVMIFKDGEKILSSDSINTTYKILEPGVYRIVVRIIPTFPIPDGKKWVPWIITNPFFIK